MINPLFGILLIQEIEQERTAMADYEKRIRAEGRAAAEKAVAAAQPNELSTFRLLALSLISVEPMF